MFPGISHAQLKLPLQYHRLCIIFAYLLSGIEFPCYIVIPFCMKHYIHIRMHISGCLMYILACNTHEHVHAPPHTTERLQLLYTCACILCPIRRASNLVTEHAKTFPTAGRKDYHALANVKVNYPTGTTVLHSIFIPLHFE